MGDDGMNSTVVELGARLRSQLPDPDDLALARLRAARQVAVRAMPATTWTRVALPFAVAALLMLTVGLGLRTTTTSAPATVAAQPSADLELLLGEEDLEFLDQLEFYAWLDMRAETGADGVG